MHNGYFLVFYRKKYEYILKNYEFKNGKLLISYVSVTIIAVFVFSLLNNRSFIKIKNPSCKVGIFDVYTLVKSGVKTKVNYSERVRGNFLPVFINCCKTVV